MASHKHCVHFSFASTWSNSWNPPSIEQSQSRQTFQNVSLRWKPQSEAIEKSSFVGETVYEYLRRCHVRHFGATIDILEDIQLHHGNAGWFYHGVNLQLEYHLFVICFGFKQGVLYLGALRFVSMEKAVKKVIGAGSQKVSIHIPRSTGDFIGIQGTTKRSFYVIHFYENNCVPAPMNKLGCLTTLTV